MPIYEYTCTACDHSLETIQKFSDSPLVKCPNCGQETLKKMLSVPSFRLKGTGWYETDFKGGKKSEQEKAPTSPCQSGNCACALAGSK